MPRHHPAPSLKSDSGPDDLPDPHDDEGSIFMADATSSGNSSDLEKEASKGREADDYDDYEDYEQEDITEGSSLLPSRRATYGGISLQKSMDDFTSNGKSVPSVIYASPARPHLPSPSTSNTGVTGLYILSCADNSDTGDVFTV
jgi:hypothetical protein